MQVYTMFYYSFWCYFSQINSMFFIKEWLHQYFFLLFLMFLLVIIGLCSLARIFGFNIRGIAFMFRRYYWLRCCLLKSINDTLRFARNIALFAHKIIFQCATWHQSCISVETYIIFRAIENMWQEMWSSLRANNFHIFNFNLCRKKIECT